jgi:hypothetical protein
VEYINNYGVTQMRLGQLWEAKESFERALKKNAYFDNANRNLQDLTAYMRQVRAPGLLARTFHVHMIDVCAATRVLLLAMAVRTRQGVCHTPSATVATSSSQPVCNTVNLGWLLPRVQAFDDSAAVCLVGHLPCGCGAPPRRHLSEPAKSEPASSRLCACVLSPACCRQKTM